MDSAAGGHVVEEWGVGKGKQSDVADEDGISLRETGPPPPVAPGGQGRDGVAASGVPREGSEEAGHAAAHPVTHAMTPQPPYPHPGFPAAHAGMASAPPAVPGGIVTVHTMSVGLCDCCASPGGCCRALYVFFDHFFGCGCSSADVAAIGGESWCCCCLFQGPISWFLPFILRPILACSSHSQAYATLGVQNPGCCANFCCALCCAPCKTCQILNEFDRRRAAGMRVVQGVPFGTVTLAR